MPTVPNCPKCGKPVTVHIKAGDTEAAMCAFCRHVVLGVGTSFTADAAHAAIADLLIQQSGCRPPENDDL